MASEPQSILCTPPLVRLFGAHLDRHLNESGQRHSRETLIFHPLDDAHLSQDAEHFTRWRSAWTKPPRTPGWGRAWGVVTGRGTADERMIAHVQLDGGRLESEVHRAILSIGVEAAFQRKGMGKALLQQAISFARDVKLETLLLRTFEHNAGAQKLYLAHGFIKMSTDQDAFRIRGQKINDCTYRLDLIESPI